MKKAIMVLALSILMSSWALAIDISSCGQNLNSGDYVLTQDVTASSGSCLILEQDDITIDCQGFSMTNTGSASTGIELLGDNSVSNVVIENCIIEDFSEGMNLGNSSHVTINNCTFSGNNLHIQKYAVTGEDTVKSNFTFSNNNFSETADGDLHVFMNNVEDVHFLNNDFSDIYTSGNGIIILANVLGTVQDTIEVVGNTFNYGTVANSRVAFRINFDTGAKNVTNLKINDNEFNGVGFGILLSSGNNYIAPEITGNTFDNVIAGALQCNGCVGGEFTGNTITRTSGVYADYYKVDLRTSSNFNIEDNTCTGGTGNNTVVCYRSLDSTYITFRNNTADTVWAGFDCRDSDYCSYINNNVVDASVVDEVYGGEAFGFRIRGTGTGHIVTGNSVEDSNTSLLFRTGSNQNNVLVGNNTFTDSKLGVDFSDATLASSVVVKNNNFVNLLDVFSGDPDSATIEENYYGDGEVASIVGYCVETPYNDSGITDDSPFCCLDGWILGCSYTSPATGYVVQYTEDDIPEAVIDTIVKALIVLGTLVTIIVIFVGYTYFQNKMR